LDLYFLIAIIALHRFPVKQVIESKNLGGHTGKEGRRENGGREKKIFGP
jgi:hypothetical protein